LSSKELKETFRAALERSRPLLQAPSTASNVSSSASPGSLSDLQKLQFYGYFKQATKGDITDEEANSVKADAAERAKVEAWKKCKSLSRRDAMRAFVYLMYHVDPTWDAKKSLETVPECA
jgi:acyl-CoA-binding protein